VNTLKVAILVSFVIVLSSFAMIKHETRLVSGELPNEDVSKEHEIYYYLHLSSSCVGDSPLAEGPWATGPLPIIPNPLWPVQHHYRNKAPGVFTISVTPSAGVMRDYHFGITIDGAPLKMTAVKFTSRMEYTFNSDKNCGELEDKAIYVVINGESAPTTIGPIFLKHRWRLNSKDP
jgi:hypothetical protein